MFWHISQIPEVSPLQSVMDKSKRYISQNNMQVHFMVL